MLLPVGDRTVIGTIFDALEREDRIDDVYVSRNEAFADTFETYLEDADYGRPNPSIQGTTKEAEKSGVIGTQAILTVQSVRPHSEAPIPFTPRYCS